jgi:hypothetical protein
VVCRNENAVLQTCRPLVLSFHYTSCQKSILYVVDEIHRTVMPCENLKITAQRVNFQYNISRRSIQYLSL